MTGLHVWIDQDLCTGDGLCVEICPVLFEMGDDGLAYVKEADWPNLFGPAGSGSGPALQGAAGQAAIPADQLDATIEAAEDCPGECIFIEAGS